MKATSSLLASILLLSACGNIVDETPDPAGDANFDPNIDADPKTDGPFGEDAGVPEPDAPPPPPELPFLTETPQAASTPGSLFAVSFANAEIRNVIGETSAEARYDILEQRIVTTTADPISVTISITAPTGVYARTIATDTTRNSSQPIGPQVTCATNGVFRFDLPECNTAPPPKSATQASGAITQARWKLSLVNEATNTKVTGCVANGAFSITCALPAGAGVAYKVMLSADGFSQLWNGTAGLTDTVLDGKRFTGVLGALEFQCDPSLYEGVGNYEYCYAHWVYNRFTGVDAAALSFDPMTITIAAGGATKQMPSPTLTWDAGNDDLPGAAY
ncbi:MAG: hypothetical protein AB7T06_20915 [Kofleriaceae bacterium]